MLDDPDNRRAAGRERQRRSRDRRARGRTVFDVEADEGAVIRTLVQSGRLSADEALRRTSVESALAAMVADWIERWRQRTGHA
jgi:hypothetical protein